MTPEHVHLWCGLELQGVPEIDLVIWDEKAGVFVVEVKAFGLDYISQLGPHEWKLGKDRIDKPPHLQAMGQLYDLIGLCKRRGRTAPWISATAALPQITRDEWRRRVEDSHYGHEWAESVLFKEDFESGYSVFRRRLEHIWENPPARRGSDRPFRHDARTFKRFDELVNAPAVRPQPPAPSDLERLRKIEGEVGRQTRETVPAFGGKRVMYSGYPGTGKTFRLLQIGADHISEGASALFVCFNKVLAADIRRSVLAGKASGSRLAEKLEVFDSWELLRTRKDAYPDMDWDLSEVSGAEVDYNEIRAAEAVELLSADEDQLPKFDTVLIDEAQDMSSWQLTLAELHLKPGGTLVVASGKSQELYGDRSERLGELESDCEPRELRRNFRNTSRTFQLAFVANEAGLDVRRLPRSVEMVTRKRAGRKEVEEQTLPFEFEREAGRFPILKYLNYSELQSNQESDPFLRNQAERDLEISQATSFIDEQLRELRSEDRPMDLLILVPKPTCRELDVVREALKGLRQPFFDLTDEELRRQPVPPDHVRVSTFHSARGIEGVRVLIFGFEKIEALAQGTGTAAENLAYIVLSRAQFETVLVIRDSTAPSVAFVQEAILQLVKATE